MSIRFLGAILVVAACGGVGFRLAAAHRADMLYLRSLISALDFMECELNYRLTPLPQLCRQAATEHRKTLGSVFERLALELDSQISPSVECCMRSAVASSGHIPASAQEALLELGSSLGNFGLEGQIQGIRAVRESCRRRFEELDLNKDARLRSYQTLGLCAGAALAILLI